MLIAVGLGTIVLGIGCQIYCRTEKPALCRDDGKSRMALDLMLREIHKADSAARHPATQVAHRGQCDTNTFSWSSASGKLIWAKTGQNQRVLLTGCDNWSFTMYLRAADANGNFVPTTTPSLCKLINMAWKCTRNNILKKINSESVVTAEVVLRNKP
jgi:hypothetical protein